MIAFREVTRTGSFSAASRQLNVSPASISRSIARLEEDLGVRLVNRTTRRLNLTQEGSTYLRVIGPALDALDDAKSMIHDQRDGAQGLVRISLPVGFGKTAVIPALNDFLNQNPGLDLEIIFEDVSPDLTSRSLDMAVQFGDPVESSYLIRRLYVVPVFLVASPGYLSQYGIPKKPRDLINHYCMPIQWSKDFPFWVLVPIKGNKERITVGPLQGRIEVGNQFEIHYDASKSGLGVTAANLSTIESDLKSGDLRMILPDYCVKMPFPRCDELSLVTPHRNHVPIRTQIVKDFLIKCAASSMQRMVNPEEFSA